MSKHWILGLLALGCVPLAVTPARCVDWPQFRGPGGQGHTLRRDLPQRWSTSRNIRWKRAVPGVGWSSPVLATDRIYLTSAVPVDGVGHSLRLLCLEAGSGEIRWDEEVFLQLAAQAPRIHKKNSHASPTPIIDGGRIFVHFGHFGTACLDLDGNVVWKNQKLAYDPVHGNGGSPIVVGNKLIFSCDGAESPFLVALDKSDGSVLWNVKRRTDAVKQFSFSTPLLIRVDGQLQVISPGSNSVSALNPDDGSEIWRVEYDGYSVIPKPVFGNGLVYICTGYNQPTVMAIRPTVAGNVTETHVAWVVERGAPHTPSLLLLDDMLFMVSDRGIASCLNATNGQVHWQQRVRGNYSASPLFGDGKIYLQNEEGLGTVIRPSKRFQRLAQNDLGERTLASYAVGDGVLYIRSEQHLYCVEE